MDDPLDFIDFADILQHGDPGNWTFVGPKPGSPVVAHSPAALPGTMKHYDIYKDEFGAEIEVHYFRHTDGSVGDAGPARTLGNLDQLGRLAPGPSISYTFLRANVLFPSTEILP